MRERPASGKPAPLGPFQYTLTIKPFVKDGKDEIALEPQQVSLRGVVRGDVVVVGAENGVRLDTFDSKEGTRQEVQLTTDRTDVDLQLVSAPEFTKVKLDKHKPEGGRPQWTLTLEIAPGAAEGTFPRPGVEAYRDCTIVLRIGEGGRDIRIPVSGVARR